MENLKFYNKHPGLIPFSIFLLLIFIVFLFILEIWPIIGPLIDLLNGDWILAYALGGSILVGIYAFILLLFRLIKRKRPILFYILTVFGVLISSLFLIIYGYISSPGPGSHYNASIKADMRQIISAQELYYNEFSHYATSPSYPESIGRYLVVTPKYPLDNRNYEWIDNSSDGTKFCAYGILWGGGYYTASHEGNFLKKEEPKSLDDCAVGDSIERY